MTMRLFQSRWWMAERFQFFAMIEHKYTHMDDLFAHVPRCILGAGGHVGGEGRREGAVRPRRRLRNVRNGIPRSQLHSHPDLTRLYSGLLVIAFCLFIIWQPHIRTSVCVRRSLPWLWDGTGAYRTRISSRTNAMATGLRISISTDLICSL